MVNFRPHDQAQIREFNFSHRLGVLSVVLHPKRHSSATTQDHLRFELSGSHYLAILRDIPRRSSEPPYLFTSLMLLAPLVPLINA